MFPPLLPEVEAHRGTDNGLLRRCMPGVTTKELMARIGHSSPRAALIYQHATEERDRAIAAFLDEQVAAAAPTTRAPVVELRGADGGLPGG